MAIIYKNSFLKRTTYLIHLFFLITYYLVNFQKTGINHQGTMDSVVTNDYRPTGPNPKHSPPHPLPLAETSKTTSHNGWDQLIFYNNLKVYYKTDIWINILILAGQYDMFLFCNVRSLGRLCNEISIFLFLSYGYFTM